MLKYRRHSASIKMEQEAMFRAFFKEVASLSGQVIAITAFTETVKYGSNSARNYIFFPPPADGLKDMPATTATAPTESTTATLK